MIVATEAQVQHIESYINTIYSIITYGMPLLAAVCVTLIGLYYRLQQQVKQNQAALGTIAHATNGKLDQVASTVEAINATVSSRRVRATDPGIGTGPAPDPGGAELPPSAPPVQPVDVQPPGGTA